MKLKTVTFHKNIRQTIKFRDNFRTVEVGLDETYELEENEQVQWNKIWDDITYQLRIQMGLGEDPSWLTTDEEKAKPWEKTKMNPKPEKTT